MGEIFQTLGLSKAGTGQAHYSVDGGRQKIHTCAEWVTFPNCGQLTVTFTGVTKCPGVAGGAKDWPSDINTTFILPYVCSSVLQDCDFYYEVAAGGWTIWACIDRVTKDLIIGSRYNCAGCGSGFGIAGYAKFEESNCGNIQGFLVGVCGVGGNDPTSCNTRQLTTVTGHSGHVSWQYDTTGC